MRSLLFVLAVTAAAQSQITGTVSDPLGTPVDNAQIQAKNTTTGSVARAVASKTGAYTLANLPAGAYDISVNVPGLRPFERKGVATEASKTLRIDIRLEDTTQLGTLGEDRLAIAAATTRHGQTTGPTPRTAAGKPDFSGVWWSPSTTDPGKPEWLPSAVAIAKQRADNNRKDSPQAHCLPPPVLRLGPIFQFVQSQAFLIVISDDDSPGFHQIYLDGRSHPKDPNPAWYGHAVAKWDGDTLVVDKIGFNDKAWLDQEGHPVTEKLHLVERYRRPDLGHLEMESTVEDPGVLAKPYTMKRVADLAASEEIYEFICPENNQDADHLVGK
jgi:hypothetical protein